MKPLDDTLPLISIVVPSFNQGQYLHEALESIFRQNYPLLEVIVMDGGSTDDSVNIIRSFEQKLAYWQSRPDDGQTVAINDGVRRCNGELITWLNADDFYWKDSLLTVGRAYATYPKHGLYIGNGLRYNQNDNRYTPFCRRHLALNRDALINGIDYILQPSTFFLRNAWEEVGGLKRELRFCMDWDIIIRIADRYPAVLINEFLAVSREYEGTKTSGGKMSRAIEILQMIRSHTQREITPGSLFYQFETLLDITDDANLSQLRYHFYEGMKVIRQQFAQQYGNSDGFPEIGDSQDSVYLPFSIETMYRCSAPSEDSMLPSISIIIPSLNQAQFLEQALESIFSQGYPKLETIVFDGGSSDGSVDILRRYDDRLTYWVSEPDSGPAHAINKGFAKANGELLAWLNSDDMFACDALWEVGRAFAEDAELDMIFANALYIDEHNRVFLVDHGVHRTGLYYGEMQPKEIIPAYWGYIHSVPQPTVFFRRHLLDACGYLGEEYNYIFDFELFWRFSQKAKIKKIERILAFYRIHSAAKNSDWNKFEVELYRFSRPLWPSLRKTEFWTTYRDFVIKFMRRHFNWLPRGFHFWSVATLVGLSALTRIGNPEKFLLFRLPSSRVQTVSPSQPHAMGRLSADGSGPPAQPSPQAYRVSIKRDKLRYQTAFCSYFLPRHPGHSGGEIRDFYLIRYLLKISNIDFFSLYHGPPDEREEVLLPLLDSLHAPEIAIAGRPDLIHSITFRRTFKSRVINYLRRKNFPVIGPRYHFDAAERFPSILSFTRVRLQKALNHKKPDFLFVSPQSNPVALTLEMKGLHTRLIMATYDVEGVRMRRLAESRRGISKVASVLEARRAERFEQENLALYDGVIAVTKLDKSTFVDEYGFPSDRVVVIANGVDPYYFSFTERRISKRPVIVYIGSFTYLPNQQAAWRLLNRIMPIIWRQFPNARLWIVGQGPGRTLQAQSDGQRILVTDKVDDVRPYLGGASVACVPLISGSGTKYKVLEALSVGVPLVCTPLAVEGLELEDGKHLLLGESDDQLAAAVVRLIKEPKLSSKLSMQGREWVEKRYAWDVILPRLDEWLEMLAAFPRRRKYS